MPGNKITRKDQKRPLENAFQFRQETVGHSIGCNFFNVSFWRKFRNSGTDNRGKTIEFHNTMWIILYDIFCDNMLDIMSNLSNGNFREIDKISLIIPW